MLGRFEAQHADLGAVDGALAPGLGSLDHGIGGPIEVVGRLVDLAGRMEVIADRAFCPLRDHGAAFVEQRVGLLVAADFAPEIMEFAGHAEKIYAEFVDIAGADREMLIAPEGGRQRFDLEVAEIFEDVAAAAADMAESEEYPAIGIALERRGTDALEELDLRLLGELHLIDRIGPVEAARFSFFCAQALTVTFEAQMSMKMPSFTGNKLVHLLDLPAEIVEIGRVEIHPGPAGSESARRAGGSTPAFGAMTRQPGCSRADFSSQPAEI